MTMRTVHLAVYDTLADWEVGAATAHINKPDWQAAPGTFTVRTVGPTLDRVVTKAGVRITPDLAIDDLRPEDSAMLVLPGADLWMSGDLAAFEEKALAFLHAGVPVAAICGATFGLARAGLLDTRTHTSNAPEFLAYSGYAGADRYVTGPAVTDGDLVTASGTAPVDFAREVFARLGVYEPHILDAWYRLFTEHDPAAYAVLDAYDRERAAV